jgi:hypothetical protein
LQLRLRSHALHCRARSRRVLATGRDFRYNRGLRVCRR